MINDSEHFDQFMEAMKSMPVFDMITQLHRLQEERDKWQDIAERLYNASQETDYSIMVKASKAYEEAASGREEG